MKIANYVLLGLLSCVEVLAEETTAFDNAVEAYRTNGTYGSLSGYNR